MMTALRVPLLKQVETLNYRPGGFHPVHLGDHFKKDRYYVIHKLGHGGFATVWLARDSTRNRYVALKILAARLSRDCPEVHPGKSYVMFMLDHFWITGPNGKHLCVVSQVGGPSIKQFNECPGQSSGTRRLRAIVARKVALQVTEGLAYIHSTGTVHGDFTSANILLQLANIDEWSEEEIYESLGKPETQSLHHASSGPLSESSESSAPRYTINAISMHEVDPQFLSDQIIIIDFGIAFNQEYPSLDIGTPKPYCAPEFLFEGGRSVSSDIWALGCTIFEIRTGSRLFRYRGRPTRNQALIAMVKLLGTLPQKWWEEWEEGVKWYANEIEADLEVGNDISGALYHQIMQVGLHDGDYPAKLPKDESLGHGDEGAEPRSTDDNRKGSTSRMIAMVGELTTSEANEVMELINKVSSESAEQHKSDAASSRNIESGSGSGNKTTSGSSNAKSGDKSISSEGLSTGLIRPSSSGMHENVNAISDESQGVPGMFDLATATALVREFLEPEGTRVATLEAKGLENLLRSALMYLPEDRLSASELAKHHWFFDTFKVEGVVAQPAA
ncbi:kinase-like domain-containing protein [Rhexocercosporidium sp. MPI-PUGE-AT-0058]|nr:kinase-like domain-containing protein [Rhexocercosporidium sp. MPI-PUGE-AT-0058]